MARPTIKAVLLCATPVHQIDLRSANTTDKTANLKDKECAEDSPFKAEELVHLSPGPLKTGCCKEKGCTILRGQQLELEGRTQATELRLLNSSVIRGIAVVTIFFAISDASRDTYKIQCHEKYAQS
jgi:hypothetical protein